MSAINPSANIYLKFGGKKMVIPVNPEEIKVSYPTDNKEYDVIGIGKVVVPRKPALKEVSWDSFFPANTREPYVEHDAYYPNEYMKKIESAMKKKQKIRLIITRSELYDMNMRCIISDFETTDKGGEPGDMYYSIKLQEYRDYSPETVSITTASSNTSSDQGQTDQTAQATAEEERPVENPVMRVGATVIANGQYWYSSTGAKPFGTANNLQTTVTRIVQNAQYPICIGSYGWIAEDQLQIVG